MRILITTGLAINDVGGPAQYGPRLKEEFEKLGHQVRIVQYGSIENALFNIWPSVLWADRVIALDTISVGVPSVLAAKIFGKKVIVRIGGDFLWESYVERTGEKVTLPQFNLCIPELNFRERLILRFTRFLVKNATKLIFNTEWQRHIWQKFYGFRDEKASMIRNYIPEKNISQENNKKFLWAGRKIKLKNIEVLHELPKEFDIEIVSNLQYSVLQEKIKNCYAVVLPSFSEVCPNFILEAVSYGKPFIMTEETGLKEIYNKGGIFINPFNKKALEEAILAMSDQNKYEKYKKEIVDSHISRSWQEVAEDFLNYL